MNAVETEKELSIYESMAARFDVAARKLNLDPGLEKYLRTPNREIIAAGIADPWSTWIGAREVKSREVKLSRDGSRRQVLVAVPGL